MSGTTQAAKSGNMFLILPILVIGEFLWRVLIPANEYSSQAYTNFGIFLDIMMLVGLFGMRGRLEPGFLDEDRRQLETALFWLALAAAIGLFVIRLTSGAAWSTGHLRFVIAR